MVSIKKIDAEFEKFWEVVIATSDRPTEKEFEAISDKLNQLNKKKEEVITI